MQAFLELYNRLDASTRTRAKVQALADYFRQAPAEDAAWALALLMGRRQRRAVRTPDLRLWAAEYAGIPEWLLAECYDAVGDLSETLSLLVADHTTDEASVPAQPHLPSGAWPLHRWMQDFILPLAALPQPQQRTQLTATWAQLNPRQAFLLHKLIGGAFRVGVSHQLMLQGLALATGLPQPLLSHRLMGTWQPGPEVWHSLTAPPEADQTDQTSRPYPFYLAYALELPQGPPEEHLPSALGPPQDWSAEWKWDGIRAQLIWRQGQAYLWSRGEELMTERFPELAQAAPLLPPGTVLDGEVVVWGPEGVRPFAQLQHRIGRKTVSARLLRESPVRLLCYDLLQHQGTDLRPQPLAHRRALLAQVLGALTPEAPFLLSPAVGFSTWADLARLQAQARSQQAEGLMLKRLSSPYRDGRRRGDWWKWKVAPHTADAVLVYAQRGTGRRASLYTDYTFAVWDAEADTPDQPRRLVPFAKAYSGLTDAEIRQVDAFIRQHTLEKFGPVRTVQPQLVMELGFEGLQRSPRHKSGIAVRFPRILRLRPDKTPADADTLPRLQALMDTD